MLRRTAAIAIIAATGLTLGIGPASADESHDAPTGLVALLQGIDIDAPDAGKAQRAQAVTRLAGRNVPERIATSLTQTHQRLFAQARTLVKRLAEEQRDAARTCDTLAGLRRKALAAIVVAEPDTAEAWLQTTHRHIDALRTYLCQPLAVRLETPSDLAHLARLLEELDGYAKMLGLADRNAPTPTGELRDLYCHEVLLGEIERQVLQHNQEQAKELSEAERQCVDLINDYRMLLGLHPLKIDMRLVRASRKYAKECATENHYAHVGSLPGRETRDQRAAQEGYRAYVAENLAFGTKLDTGQEAFGEWFRSMPHHRVMINRRHGLRARKSDEVWKYPRYYTIGVGHATGGRYGHNWCLLLGTGHRQSDLAVTAREARPDRVEQ